jgi:hypothetical protein
MADASAFQTMGSELVAKIMGSIVWVGIIVIVRAAVGGAMYYFLIYSKKFDITVHIKSKRADNKYSIIVDKAAILNDYHTKTKFFRIWDLRKDFPVPKFNILQATSKGDLLEIYREGEDIFFYLTPPKINNHEVIRSDGQVYQIADQEHSMVDPDLGFWIVKRKGMNKKMFDTESMLMKLLPYLPHIIGGMIMIFMLYILMDHLPTILNALEKVAGTMANMQKAQVVPAG